MEYSPNYPLDIITRQDIISEIADSTEEYYMLDDIVRGIELNAKNAILENKTCNIPYLGSFRFNHRECYMKHADELKAAKPFLSEIEYIMYKKETLRNEVMLVEWNRKMKAYSNINANKFPKLYRTYVKQMGTSKARMIMAMMYLKPKTLPMGESMIVL
jgi:nucleoid DNA-binding protein